MSDPQIQSFFDPQTFTATHVLWCPDTREAAIIDSVLDYDPKSGRTGTQSAEQVLAHVQGHGLQVR